MESKNGTGHLVDLQKMVAEQLSKHKMVDISLRVMLIPLDTRDMIIGSLKLMNLARNNGVKFLVGRVPMLHMQLLKQVQVILYLRDIHIHMLMVEMMYGWLKPIV